MTAALVADVARERIEVGGTERLGPIARLPVKGVGQEGAMVHVVSARALHALNHIGEGDRGGDADDEVDVIRCRAGGEEDAPQLPALVAEDGVEGGIESDRQERPSAVGGPHDMDEQEGRRPSRHALPSASRRKSCRSGFESVVMMETGAQGRAYPLHGKGAHP